MIIQLFNTIDDDTVIGKSLSLKYEIEMELKDRQNISQPTIYLYEGDMDLQSVNYAYIPHFERYYFVRTYNMGPNQVYELLLECDVIESFKEEILASEAEITRNIKEGDYKGSSSESEVRKEVDIHKSNRGFSDDTSIVLTTISAGREL